MSFKRRGRKPSKRMELLATSVDFDALAVIYSRLRWCWNRTIPTASDLKSTYAGLLHSVDHEPGLENGVVGTGGLYAFRKNGQAMIKFDYKIDRLYSAKEKLQS